MVIRIAAAAASLLAVLAVTGCAPSAKDMAAAARDVRGASPRPLLVHPTPGHGTAALTPFTPQGDFSVVVRCLGDAHIGLTISGEKVPAVDCSDGMRTVGRRVAHGPVDVTVNAPDGVYWVAGVVTCTPIPGGITC